MVLLYERSKNKKPLGDLTKDTAHLLSHIKEKYYVPSLIINALEDAGVNPIFWWSSYSYYRDLENRESKYHVHGTLFSRAVKRYLKLRFGIAK